MTLDSFISKLNQNVEIAKENLRDQLSKKVIQLMNHIEDFSTIEIRGELENLVDDFLRQFSTIYEEILSYIEVELPAPKPKPKPKPKKKRAPRVINKDEFVRPTYVKRAFNDEGLRVAKDAKPMLIDLLNKRIKHDIEKIKMQLPTYQKGKKEGEKRRITIKPEDLSAEDLLKMDVDSFEKELDTIPIKWNGNSYKLLILLREFD